MCEHRRDLVFSLFPALKSVNGTPTSSSREMIQSAFISLTHSSTCQVRSLSTEGNATGTVKEKLDEQEKSFILTKSCTLWEVHCRLKTSSIKPLRYWRLLPASLLPPQRPTFLLALWISSPTVTDTQGEELLATLSVMQQVSEHRMVTQRQLQAKLGQEQSPTAWEGPGVSTANLR